LCGDPLPKKCGTPKASQLPSSTVQENYFSESGFEWIFGVAGFGSGLVVGMVIANIVVTRRYAFFRVVKRRR
jgi:hypothetical protein